jgi:thiol-disulfide isomerase/thioredoxin
MKKSFFTILSFLLVLLTFQTNAQSDSYSIRCKVKGLKDTVVLLAHYYGYKEQIVKDTAKVDANGVFQFVGKKKLPEGLYLVSLPKGKFFDLVIGNTDFSIETDTTNLIKNMKVKGSKENELFYAFQQEMSNRFDELRVLDTERKMKPGGLTDIKIKRVQDEISKYQQDWQKQNEGTLVAKFIKSSQDPEVPMMFPNLPKLPNGGIDSTALQQARFAYYKSHFWDNFDLTDERMMRTPFLVRRLERYMDDLTYQTPDSIAKTADELLLKVKGSKDLRKYVVYKITSNYESSKLMGLEGAYIHMFEKYYINEQALWDTSTIRRVKERVSNVKPNLIGKPFPTMILTDTLGRQFTPEMIPAEYTVVFIYDTECGHCRESAPKLMKSYQVLKNQGVRVIATPTNREKIKWMKFIKEFKFEELINGIDLHKDPQNGKEVAYTDFKNNFDVYATPVVYVLDKEKKIIARRLPVEQLEDFMGFYIKQKERDKQKSAKAGK